MIRQVFKVKRHKNLSGLNGYCLYKDGQLIPPPQEVPPMAQPPMAQYPQQQDQPYQENTVDSNGKCCPQPNPISINITNSQDTNSRNTNSTQQSAQSPRERRGVRRERVMRMPVIQRVPVYQKLIQRVPYPVIQKVPVEVIKNIEVPVVKNTYTERLVHIPITGCEGKEFFYPAWT